MERDIVGTLVTYFEQGGFVMWPLLVATLVLWYVLGYRFMSLQRGTTRSVYTLIDEYRSGKRRTPTGLVDRACFRGVQLLGRAKGNLRPVLDDAFAELKQELNIGKRPVGAIVAAAPLLGLLGTVTGMIETFDSLADMSFYSQSGGIAGGIAEALFTTQMGLVVAVPGVIIGRLLERRQTALEDEIERVKDYLCAQRAELDPRTT
jgi:biopolymer transport protein ExbB